MLYLILKYVHVLAAIVAVGANLTYGVWLARARRQPESLGFALHGVRFLDNRLANPAYVLLLITGLGMAHAGAISLRTPWLLVSLVLYVVLALVGMAGYTPTLRRQIEALERSGAASPEYAALAARGRRLGGVLAVLVLAIVYFMTVKPALWG